MSPIKKFLLSILLCFIILFISLPIQPVSAKRSSSKAYVVLSQYTATMDIGNEFYLFAAASKGQLPTWKSSSSRIASVNSYGKVTAKKSGSAIITARIKNGKASCKVTVNKTKITISNTASIERGETLILSASTSNNSNVSWKSSKKSVATIDENGTVTGVKPGETTITASADGSKKTCKIRVKLPTIHLDQSKITLYRCQSAKLSASVSSLVNPTWKTNKKSVAIVDEYGTITAIKHGTARITATVDGISKSCNIVVEKPSIALSSDETCLKIGDTATITAIVSSGNSPTWSSSNTKIATVDTIGTITALQKGKAYIYATEDGVKVRCHIHVTK